MQVKSGAERRRRKALKTAAVVGVTCCSAGLPVLDGMQFDVVVLDEASQMVEPLSLLPLLRCACRHAANTSVHTHSITCHLHAPTSGWKVAVPDEQRVVRAPLPRMAGPGTGCA